MKGLPTLCRIHRSQVDELRRRMAVLEAEGALAERRAEVLSAAVASEGDAVAGGPASALAFPAYAAGALRRMRDLRARQAAVQAEAAALRDDLLDVLRQVKGLELAHQRRRERDHAAAGRATRRGLDELGLDRHRRPAES